VKEFVQDNDDLGRYVLNSKKLDTKEPTIVIKELGNGEAMVFVSYRGCRVPLDALLPFKATSIICEDKNVEIVEQKIYQGLQGKLCDAIAYVNERKTCLARLRSMRNNL